MAAPRKAQAKKLKFELTWSAVAGIGVIVFCLFLWMFLLGVWAGQSLLMPSHEKKNLVAEEKGTAVGPVVIRAAKKPQKTE